MKQMNKTNLIAIALVLSGIAGGGGFFAGMKYQQNIRSSFFTQMGNGQFRANTMMRNGGGTRGSFRPVAGEIIKHDDTSVTVKLADGSSKIVLITEKTDIRKTDTGLKTDLTTGTQIAVFGSENTDGSVTAQNVQINPVRMGINSPTPAQK